jgi:hypothetical protein
MTATWAIRTLVGDKLLTTGTNLSGLVRIRAQTPDLTLRAEIGITLEFLLAENVDIFGRFIERRVGRDFRAAPPAELKTFGHPTFFLKIRIMDITSLFFGEAFPLALSREWITTITKK